MNRGQEEVSREATPMETALMNLKQGLSQDGLADLNAAPDVLWACMTGTYGDADYAGIVAMRRIRAVVQIAELATQVSAASARAQSGLVDALIQAEDFAELGREALEITVSKVDDLLAISKDLDSNDPQTVSQAKVKLEIARSTLKEFSDAKFSAGLT